MSEHQASICCYYARLLEPICSDSGTAPAARRAERRPCASAARARITRRPMLRNWCSNATAYSWRACSRSSTDDLHRCNRAGSPSPLACTDCSASTDGTSSSDARHPQTDRNRRLWTFLRDGTASMPHLQSVGHEEVAIPAAQRQSDAVRHGGAAVECVCHHSRRPPCRRRGKGPLPAMHSRPA